MALICIFQDSSIAYEPPLVTESLSSSGKAVVGEPAPFLSGWTLDGKVFNTRKPFRDAEVRCVALVFWATWCVPCIEGIDLLSTAHEHLEEAGVQVILVNLGQSEAIVRAFFEYRNKVFPVVMDRFRIAESEYIVSDNVNGSLPRTVLIGSDGTVKAIFSVEGGDYVERIIDVSW